MIPLQCHIEKVSAKEVDFKVTRYIDSVRIIPNKHECILDVPRGSAGAARARNAKERAKMALNIIVLAVGQMGQDVQKCLGRWNW